MIMKVENGQLRLFKLVPISLDLDLGNKPSLISLKVKPSEIVKTRKIRKINKFDSTIINILEQYSSTETVPQISQRIKDMTGKNIPVSSIYNWKYKAKKTQPNNETA